MTDADKFRAKMAPKPRAPTKTKYVGPSKIELNISNIHWLTVLKCMDRAISSIKNKKQVKEKTGAYYHDFIEWSREYEKIAEIAKLSKLMEAK